MTFVPIALLYVLSWPICESPSSSPPPPPNTALRRVLAIFGEGGSKGVVRIRILVSHNPVQSQGGSTTIIAPQQYPGKLCIPICADTACMYLTVSLPLLCAHSVRLRCVNSLPPRFNRHGCLYSNSPVLGDRLPSRCRFGGWRTSA